jgi:uncharacterized coiled-coil protein SlyX
VLKEKWAEILIGTILVAVLLTIFALNREVGEINSQSRQTSEQMKRMENQIDKLNDRLDRLAENGSSVQPRDIPRPSQTPAK